MKPVVLFVVVDALGWTLAARSPGFLAMLPERRALDTILGFSSGALPTLFTGAWPEAHGRWLMYQRAERDGVFAGFEWLRLLPERVQRSHRFGQWLTRRVRARGVDGYFNLYEVPRHELARFDLPERRDLFRPGGLPGDSLWDGLERAGVRWSGWNWRTPESEALAGALAALRAGEDDLVFVYTADLDALLHREGSRGPGVAARMARYDAWMRAAFDAAAAAGRPLWAVLCSDHGMVDVDRTVDVMRRLEPLSVRRGRDYDAFFDSTMARFWWRREGVREVVREALAGEPAGHWCTPEELRREHCAFADARYGEDVFLLEPGALLVPSFMGSHPLAAMHGYAPSHPDMAAFLATNRPLPDTVRHIADVRSFVEAAWRGARGGVA